MIPYSNKKWWEEVLEQAAVTDVFYLHSYSDLYRRLGDGEPQLFVYTAPAGQKVYYSFLKKRLGELKFLGEQGSLGHYYDIITIPYGYGGPLTDSHSPEVIKAFRLEFGTFCEEEKIVSEFVRFHPLLENYHFVENDLDVSNDRETVAVDLTKTQEELMADYHKNHRRNLRKAEKHGLEFHTYQGKEAVKKAENFYSLYTQTMDKLQASSYSYFSLDYVKNLMADMGSKAVLCGVYAEEKMIAAAICLYENDCLHYHLGCSDQSYIHIGSNVFLLHECGLWGKRSGCHTFHLGGGHSGRDSLFTFKHRFSQQKPRDFFIGKKIHNQQVYDKLVNQWEEHYKQPADSGFFPAYRSLPQTTAAGAI
ncbi:lipid II:glycine glycyltransferase FemX [Alteribacillus sp. HJP-4]|uniref:lipid II:glycine glycyltransferase FemX n=1 Tax=Alteribacillus sp. HJP-4 TaxID=2775394 RepID=UPI0035CD2419